MANFGSQYSDESFWAKARTFAGKAGREVIEKALTLYHTLQDPETPRWARGTIVGVLGYFILPIDAVPDVTPMVGFFDDLGALVVAFGTVTVHIKPEHRARARETTNEWLGSRDDDSEPPHGAGS